MKVTVEFTLPPDTEYDADWLRDALSEMENETGITAFIVPEGQAVASEQDNTEVNSGVPGDAAADGEATEEKPAA